MYKLIIVEDEKLVRENIAFSIKNGNIDIQVVGEAENGVRALELVKEVNPDIILTDICMSKMDGLEFIECVKEINANIKIVIVSGYDDFSYAQKAIRLGVC